MITTITILAFAAFFFVQGKIRADIVGICTVMALMLCGILTPQEGLSGFASNITMMLVCVFIVGGAVSRTGLAKIISNRVLALAGQSETRLFVLIMLATAGIGAFVSNTGTVAVMMPIVISLAAGIGTSPSRFLLPLAFASTMGGMLTLIGTTPNMIISGALEQAGYGPLNFFAFLPIGIICVTIGTFVLIPMSKLLVKPTPKRADGSDAERSLQELANKYHLKESEFKVHIPSGSPIIGKPLQDLVLQREFGVSLSEIRRKRLGTHMFDSPTEQIVPMKDTCLQEGDTFTFVAPKENIETFLERYSLHLLDEEAISSKPEQTSYGFDGFGIAELVVLSSSTLIDLPIKNSGLTENYGIRILGVQRKNETFLQNLPELTFQAGDTLLVQGKWKHIARLEENRENWVVVGKPLDAASRETLDHKAPLCAIIVLTMIIAMAANLLEPVMAVMLAALALIATKCFRTVEEAYKTISWQSVVLVASMLPASVALEKTGAASAASEMLIAGLGSMGPYALLAGIYGAASFATLFVSNTAAGALCTPIALQAAVSMGLSPYPFLFAVATAASMSLAFPFSTPPNVLVMAPGRYEFMDYVKVGGPLQLIFGIVMIIVLPLLFPFS